MKQLSILYFLSVASEGLGGADHTLFMQALLMRNYHNVTLVLPCGEDGKANEKFRKKCEAAGLEYEVFFYDAAIAVRAINLAEHKRDIDRIGRFVLEKKIDILHSVQINPAVEFISRKYGIPHVMNIYSMEEWEWKVPCPDVFPQYVSCDSEFYQKKWMEYLKCRGRCVRVYDDAGVKKQTITDKWPVVIGAAGLVCEYKNYLEVIKAVEMIRKEGRNVRLLIAGDDSLPYATCCREYIRQHQLADAVQLLGFVDDMRAFWEKADVFVCGSRRESFPASVVEAVSCNMPVISTPVAGIPEILTDQKNAYLSCGYSADELAEAIRRFLGDYENGKLGEILAGERDIYEGYFTAEAVKKQLEGLYGEMQGNRAAVRNLRGMERHTEEIMQLAGRMEKEGMEAEDIRLAYSRLLYFCQIKDRIAGRQCYIWGAGRWGKMIRIITKCLDVNIRIAAFVDKNRKTSVGGIRVIKKEEMDIQENTAVLISFARGQEEAVAYLENKNMEIMKNIFIMA